MDDPVKTEPFPGERIAKRIARSGHCSRRDAERLIAAGQVMVNGEVLLQAARNVTAQDLITINGAVIDVPEGTRLWRYHKPSGLVVSHRDPQGRPTVFEALAASLPRVVSIGRLDLNTEGLLLLTNDGELSRHLELPVNGWMRRYRVRVYGTVDEQRLTALKDGIEIDGVRYGSIEASIDRQQDGTNMWLKFAIREGKNREVKRVCEALGLAVNRLIRTDFGPFSLDLLERGEFAEVPPNRIYALTGFQRAHHLG